MTALKKIWRQISAGFLNHLGAALCIFSFFVITQIYFRIGWIKIQVEKLPSVWLFTVIIFLLLYVVYLHIKRMREHVPPLVQPKQTGDELAVRMVTHYGIWWKLDEEREYVEDFPYCPCCEPHKKLIQKEWHPDEVYYCPVTKNEIKIHGGDDGMPVNREAALDSIYMTYFIRSRQEFQRENAHIYQEFKKENPNVDEKTVLNAMLENIRVFRENDQLRADLIKRFPEFNKLNKYISDNIKSFLREARESGK